MSAHQMLREFHRVLAQAGLPEMRFYDHRHSAASILLVKGVHPKVAQEVLGHASIATIMNTYSHVMSSLQKEIAGVMDNIFNDTPVQN